MGDDLSDELTSRMPIVPHETAGVECCGCIIAAVEGIRVELRCNESARDHRLEVMTWKC